ncbi:MAG: adenylate kinase [Campylobacterales bacterium]|nr:adenylate kinase [Campylobacterales bacterium]
MKQLFLIIGAPGSGKTTDAQLIAQRHSEQMAHYSTGDLLRAEVSSGSALGARIDSFISKGLIVPIDIAIDTIVNAIKNASSEVILFDGYPRSIEQMEALDGHLRTDAEIVLRGVIEVAVSEETACERVLGRARGSDDRLEVFNNRMRIYTEPLEAIRTFYTQKGLLHTVDAERSIEQIVDAMEQLIHTILKTKE